MNTVDIACPVCLKAGARTQLLTPDGMKFQCGAGHIFDDSEDLFHSHGKLESFSGKKFAPPPQAPPANAIAMQLAIPSPVRDALQQKFGERMDATLAAVLGALAQPHCFLVNQEDVARLSLLLRQEIASASVLCGAVYNAVEEADKTSKDFDELKKQQQSGAAPADGSAQAPVANNGVFIALSTETMVKITEKAVFNGKSPKQFLSECLEYAVENNWI